MNIAYTLNFIHKVFSIMKEIYLIMTLRVTLTERVILHILS